MSERVVKLDTMRGGAALERFNVELDRVIANVLDPNTDPKAKRSVTLKVSIKPTEDREQGVVSIDCQSKLAGMKPVAGQFFFGLDKHGKAVAVEHNPRQSGMFAEDDAEPSVDPETGEELPSGEKGLRGINGGAS